MHNNQWHFKMFHNDLNRKNLNHLRGHSAKSKKFFHPFFQVNFHIPLKKSSPSSYNKTLIQPIIDYKSLFINELSPQINF